MRRLNAPVIQRYIFKLNDKNNVGEKGKPVLKKYKRVISIILIIVLFITSCPMEVIAEQIFNINPKFENEESINKEEESQIIGEVTEKRSENTKIFLKEDKTFEAAVYPDAVHYKEGGQWKDIDNSLTDKFDSENNESVLENKQNTYKVKIAKNTKSKKLVKIKKENYELSWNIDNASNSKAQVIKKNKDYTNLLSKKQDKKNLSGIGSSVEFKDIYKNIDLKYDIVSKDIKESIVIKEKTDKSVFRFNLKLKNLVPKLMEDKTIVFYDKQDTSKQVFMMDAPFMYDAKNEISNDIQLNIKENKNEFILELVSNKEWINSTDRTYPITIDPSVSTPIERTTIKDAHVSENYPDKIDTNSTILKTGKEASSGRNRSYLSFDLPQLKTGDLITNAKLEGALYSKSSAPTQVNVHKVLSNWDSKTVTWNY